MKSILFFSLFVRLALAENNDTPDQACVTLIKFGNRQCHGKPQSERTFTTLTAPGSPCKHTAAMGDNSAKDQFCNFDQGTFKQTVFIKDTHCHVNIWEKAISPMHLSYSKSTCTYGYKLGSCKRGPCDKTVDNLDTLEMDEFPKLRSNVEASQ